MSFAGSVAVWRDRATRLGALSGWRRAGVLIALGILATLTLPPLNFVPLLWIAFSGLALMLDGANTRWRAFGTGFWFGWAHHAAGVYWIAYALLVDPEKFGWMIPFAVLGLGAFMAIFVGLGTLIAREIAPPGIARILALAAAWAFSEWLRDWVFTGFPWNLIATAWVDVLPVVQFASIAGAFGLSLLSVAITAMPAALARPNRIGPGAVGASLTVLALVAAWGWSRVPDAPMPNQPNIRLRLVQPSVPERDKWAPANRPRELLDLITLSKSAGSDKVTDVIWPETAVPYFIDQDQGARGVAAQAVPPGGLLLAGAERATLPDVTPFQVWNSLEAVTAEAQIIATYDKAHLVPFGEYMPLRHILPLDSIAAGSVDISAGPGLRTLHLPGLPPVSPLICYEDIFPGAALDRSDRPQWLLTITNDGWFGMSAGPYQHFAAGRLRAIEEGLPMVHNGNTGITAFVDPYGRVLSRLPLGAVGVLDGDLPQALPPTFFAAHGNIIALVLMAATGLIGWGVGRRLRGA
ncbi:MAG TPA: apolipoprotein N-acyltransferase [Magnetospirillaceae bacterium]